MTADEIKFKNAISKLVGADNQKKTQFEKVSDLIDAIAQASIGKTSVSPSAEASKNDIFEMLSQAARERQIEIFRELVEAERQSRQENEPTLLMAAVMEGKTEIARELVAAGADVNIRIKQFFTFDALHFAVEREYLDIVKILVDA
jgi:ankyrin repeat protein